MNKLLLILGIIVLLILVGCAEQKKCECFGCITTFYSPDEGFSPSKDYIQIECCKDAKIVEDGSCYYHSIKTQLNNLTYSGFY